MSMLFNMIKKIEDGIVNNEQQKLKKILTNNTKGKVGYTINNNNKQHRIPFLLPKLCCSV